MKVELFKKLINEGLFTRVGEIQSYLNNPELLAKLTVSDMVFLGLIETPGFKVDDEEIDYVVEEIEPNDEVQSPAPVIEPEKEIVVEEIVETIPDVEPVNEEDSEVDEYGVVETEDLEVSDADALPNIQSDESSLN